MTHRVVVGHRVHAAELVQVVLVRHVVAVPCHDVEGRVVDVALEQLVLVLHDSQPHKVTTGQPWRVAPHAFNHRMMTNDAPCCRW